MSGVQNFPIDLQMRKQEESFFRTSEDADRKNETCGPVRPLEPFNRMELIISSIK